MDAYISRGALDVLEMKDLSAIPCSHSYITMARIDNLRGNILPTPDAAIALRPRSSAEANEIAAWVNNLLTRIHNNVGRIYRLDPFPH